MQCLPISPSRNRQRLWPLCHFKKLLTFDKHHITHPSILASEWPQNLHLKFTQVIKSKALLQCTSPTLFLFLRMNRPLKFQVCGDNYGKNETRMARNSGNARRNVGRTTRTFCSSRRKDGHCKKRRIFT